jgi:hypothetical protein
MTTDQHKTDPRADPKAAPGKDAKTDDKAAKEGEDVDTTPPVVSAPDRWEVGQTEAEAEANAQIKKRNEAEAKAEAARVEADNTKAGEPKTGEQRIQEEADKTLKAVDESLQAREAAETPEQTERRKKAEAQLEKDEAHRRELEPNEATPTSRRR